MPPLLTCLAALGALACAGTVVMCLRGACLAIRVQRLDELPMTPPAEWPRLSVVVAACNEALTLEPALRSLLAQDYPALEIVVVNDRSTDATGAIVDRLASEDSRIVPVHVTSLPDGWLGKVHALHQGTQKTSGEWLLFTDADVHFAQGTLRRTVAASVENGWDHLTLFPFIHPRSVLLEALVATFGLMLVQAVSKSVVGVGAFNLVRRTVFERTPGFEWIKLEIADDTGLALMMQNAGGRSTALAAPEHVSIEWYGSAKAMVAGLEKNMFGMVGGFSPIRLTLRIGLLSAWMVAHFLVFLPVGIPWLPLFLLPVYAASVGQVRAMARRMPVGWGASLLKPVGLPMLLWIAVRSTFVTLRQGGVVWRGTLYPTRALRDGQRVKI